MSLIPGIRNVARQAATQAVASSTVLVDSPDLQFPILAGQKVHVRLCVPFVVGAAGGFKFRFNGPAAPTNYNNVQEVNDGVTASPGAQIVTVITALTDFAAAFASVAGNHVLRMEADFVASVDGDIKFQFAQNSSNATAIQILQGAYLEATLY